MLKREEVLSAGPDILKAHGIADDRSQDIKDQQTLPRQCVGILAGTLTGSSDRQVSKMAS